MRAVVHAARNSFTKLVDKLSRQFDGTFPHPGLGGRDRNSLIRVLGRGLSKICVGKSVDQKGQIVPAQVGDCHLEKYIHGIAVHSYTPLYKMQAQYAIPS
jgi:hypothetical protein